MAGLGKPYLSGYHMLAMLRFSVLACLFLSCVISDLLAEISVVSCVICLLQFVFLYPWC